MSNHGSGYGHARLTPGRLAVERVLHVATAVWTWCLVVPGDRFRAIKRALSA